MVTPKDEHQHGLDSNLLLKAYAVGLFPMAETADDPAIFWCDPPLRGLIPIQHLHISRRLKARLKQHPFKITVNRAFEQVVDGCAGHLGAYPHRPDTWINTTIKHLYTDLHHAGHAHSLECWDGNNLVGGIYGVQLGGVFCGESMFSMVKDASKIALVHMTARLWLGGFDLFDAQFMTDHLRQFGAYEMNQTAYKKALKRSVSKPCFLPRDFEDGCAGFYNRDYSAASSLSIISSIISEEILLSEFLQSTTQMS